MKGLIQVHPPEIAWEVVKDSNRDKDWFRGYGGPRMDPKLEKILLRSHGNSGGVTKRTVFKPGYKLERHIAGNENVMVYKWPSGYVFEEHVSRQPAKMALHRAPSDAVSIAKPE